MSVLTMDTGANIPWDGPALTGAASSTCGRVKSDFFSVMTPRNHWSFGLREIRGTSLAIAGSPRKTASSAILKTALGRFHKP